MRAEGEGGGASRSTDPAAGTSAATDVSLREYLTALISAAESRSDARFEAMKQTVETAFHASQVAVGKAEEATAKRFDGVNEFRAALSDQAATFVSRPTIDALVEKLEAQIDRNRQDLDALARRIDVREGQLQGSKVTIGNLIALVTVAAAIIATIVVLANQFAGP